MALSAGRAILTSVRAVILHVMVELMCGERQGATRGVKDGGSGKTLTRPSGPSSDPAPAQVGLERSGLGRNRAWPEWAVCVSDGILGC
jgi:hypothetical protein